jgi:drug/metabolite transporter (DMT)-like permease
LDNTLPEALSAQWPYAPRYADVNGWRMHYIDEGEGDPVVLLHGNPTWGFLYRDMIGPIVRSGRRVIVPDMIGFGLSEKPTRGVRSSAPSPKRPQGFILAFLWGAPFILLVVVGLQATSATLTASVTPTLMPVFAGLIAWGFLGEVPRKRQLYGYVLIVAGLLALVWDYISAEGRIDMSGAAALVAAAVMWALYTLRLRRSTLTPLQAAALICFWSAMFYLPIYFGLGLSGLARVSAQELLFQSFYQGILMSAVAIFAFNRAVFALGPRAAAAIIACAGHRDGIGHPHSRRMAVLTVGSGHRHHCDRRSARRCDRHSKT